MANHLSVLLAQLNPTVGALTKNCEKIIDTLISHQQTHDVILFPELILSGYPPEDLLLRPEFVKQVEQQLERIAQATADCFVIVGHPTIIDGVIMNSATLLHQGKQVAVYHKQVLPDYGVFDEARYFAPGTEPACLFTVKGVKLALCICEDIWQPGPVDAAINAGAQGILCLNASPYDYTKQKLREELLRQHARKGVAMIYVNLVGGQDELLFDGQSMAFDQNGKLCARLPAFVETVQSLTLTNETILGNIHPQETREAEVYKGLVLGTHDYVKKNGFPGVLLGLSGGIDSALTLAIATDALGADNVHAVMMPSRFTADMSLEDATKQLSLMNVSSSLLSIEPSFHALLDTLAPCFKGLAQDTTEENIQARIRGILLMALSNKTGKMVLTTSNKSESAVGYATLYGDMAGGFSVLKDVLKTQVYQLARYRNSIAPVIPERVITRAPSAELAANQTDQDSLPDYAILDGIIQGYMENNRSADELIADGFSPTDVQKAIRLIKRNEYKRRQAAPGIKISPRAFGRDWRYPITSGW